MGKNSTDELNTAFSKKIENLSTELLLKRKKFALLILGIMAGISLLAIITVFMTGKLNTLASVGVLVAVSIPMILGVKKVNEELEKRKITEGQVE